MIVAYVPDTAYALRDAVAEAVGLRRDGEPFRVTFRDPMTFQAPDADVLDTVVYVAEDAALIRQAYAAFPLTRLLDLGATPLPGLPLEVIPREQRPRAEVSPTVPPPESRGALARREAQRLATLDAAAKAQEPPA